MLDYDQTTTQIGIHHRIHCLFEQSLILISFPSSLPLVLSSSALSISFHYIAQC